MASSVVGLFRSADEAQRAKQALIAQGITPGAIEVVNSSTQGGAMLMVGGADHGLVADELRRHGALDVHTGAARTYSADEVDEHLVRGTFATGQTDAVLVEESNEPEGSFATGQGEPEAASPGGQISTQAAQEKGSFATGQEDPADEQVVESNQPKGTFGKGQGTQQ